MVVFYIGISDIASLNNNVGNGKKEEDQKEESKFLTCIDYHKNYRGLLKSLKAKMMLLETCR